MGQKLSFFWFGVATIMGKENYFLQTCIPCALVHFSKSTKCVAMFCGEEMHEGWWKVVNIFNLELSPNLHLKGGFDFQGYHKCI
jgi:hypothetical protein